MKNYTKVILNYFKHAIIGSVVAVSTFAVSFAATPDLVDEDAKLAVMEAEAVVTEANQDDMNYLVNYMDEDIREEVSKEVGTCTPSEYLVAYVEKDSSFATVLTDYFGVE
jgi:hypothetical protein